MSTCYWMIEGVGINTDDVYDKINKRKLINFLIEQLPDDDELRSWKHRNDLSEFDIDDYTYDSVFQNLGDLLTHCDDTNTLTFGDNGEGAYYFYYAPSMPWERTENEPKSLDEVHRRIITAVQRITDLSDVEIDEMIDDGLYEVGYG